MRVRMSSMRVGMPFVAARGSAVRGSFVRRRGSLVCGRGSFVRGRGSLVCGRGFPRCAVSVIALRVVVLVVSAVHVPPLRHR